MPSQAFAAYGSQVRLGDGIALAPLTITSASNATPIIVTTSGAHGIVDVSYVTITGVLGNTAANGAWIAQQVSPTALALRLSVGNGAYTSGGTLTRVSTFASIAEIRAVNDAGSRADLIDVSAMDGNGYSSEIPVIKRTQAMRLDVNLAPQDPTHAVATGLLGLYNSGTYRHWLLVLPPATVGAPKATGHLFGFVDYYTVNLPVNGAVGAEFELAFDGALTWTRE